MKLKSLLAAALVAVTGHAADADAAGGKPSAPDQDWTFSGIFGTYDKQQLQRGYQVYKEVCASCHSMNLVAYRNLSALGYSDDQIKALASEIEVTDGPDDEGEYFERPGIPADHFPDPFENALAAAAANGGAVPPDLSLIAKARFDGPNYLYALLAEGYVEAPPALGLPEDAIYNKYFGGAIKMAQPMEDGAVEYADGAEATLSQMSKDVVAFLNWAAEPELEARKRMGVSAILFLLVLTGMLYALKRKIWADVDH